MRTFTQVNKIFVLLIAACFLAITPGLRAQSAPEISDIPGDTILEGEAFSPINLNDFVTDLDNDLSDLTWTVSDTSYLVVSIDNSQASIAAKDEDWFGSDTITFTVTDPDLNTDSDTAIFKVLPVNDAPVVADIPDKTIAEGATFEQIYLNNYVTDVDNTVNELTWSAADYAPLDVAIDPATHVATITTPDENWNGNRTITFTATDPGTASDSDPALYTVTAVNDAPVISGLTGQTIQEGNEFADISLNDYVSDVEDADNLLTWTVAGQDRLYVEINDNTHIASITPPNRHWNGSEIITFTVTDTENLSDSESTTFEVTALAEAPVALNDSYTIAEGGTLIVPAPGVLTNDTDGDGDPLTAVWGSNPSFSSSFTLNPNGSFTYVNNGAENSSDSFTYRAFDGTSQSNTATVTITITPVNDAPSLNEFSGTELTFNEDGGAIQIMPGLLLTDPDNLTLVSAAVSISAGFQSTEDVLSFTPGSGITGSYNSSTGVLTLNGFASPASFQTVMRTIRYNNTSQNPTTTDRTIQTRVYDGEAYSNTLSKTVKINVQNDPPLIDDIPGQTIAEGSTFTTINLDNYVTDPDNADNEITWSNYGQIALTVSIVNRVATITIPNADWNGAETITFEARDPMGGYSSDPATFTVTAVDDAPVLSNIEPTNLEYAEGSGPVQITNTLTTADIDNPNLASARVWFSSNYVNDQDELSCSNTYGLTGSWNAGSGEYNLTGSGTLANYQNALRAVRYNNSSANPSAVTRTISFRVNDGTVNSNIETRNIIVNSENTAPVLADPSSSTVNYTEDAAPVRLTNTIIVNDADNTNLSGATIAITTGFLAGEDSLSFTSANGINGTYTPATGLLSLTGSATLANYQTALRSVRYNNTSDNPTIANRSISFTVSDGTSPSNVIVKTVSITAVNDAPVLTDNATAPVNYTENTPAVQLTNTITLTDADNTSVTGATITITSGFHAAEDTLSFTSANGITGAYVSATGILTLSGTTTLLNYRTALRSVRYRNKSEGPTTTNRIVSFTVTDGSAVNPASNIINKTVTITAINDAPVATNVIITAANDRIGTLNTGSFTFTDPDGDDPGTHTYKWYRSISSDGSSATLITGAITATYRPAKADGGNYIGFEVTPVDEFGLAGLPVRSAFRYINANPVATNATIYAPLTQPGSIIRGRFTYSDKEGNPRGNSTYYWYRSDVANPTPAAPGTLLTPGGTTDSTYRLVAADANKWIRYRVHPVAQVGSTPGDSIWSNIIGPIGSYSANITGSDTACFGIIMPITLTINAGQSPYTAVLRRTNSSANKDTSISGIVASPRIINVKIPGTYTLLSLTDAGSDQADISASQPVVLVINPKSKALLSGTYEICNDGKSQAQVSLNFIAGAKPWSVKFRRGVSSGNDTTFTNITQDPYTFSARVIGTSPTRYRIIEIKDVNGCSGDTTSGSAWVSYKPSPSATISGLDSICPGEPATLSIVLSSTSNPPNWNFTYLKDGATPITIPNLSSFTYNLQVTTPGIYTLAAVADQVCTGKVSGTGTIRSYEIPTATMSGTQTICQHTSGNLSVALTGHAPWSYKYRRVGVDTTQLIGVTSNPNLVAVRKAGTYNLLEVYDKNCKGTVSGSATITVTPAPEVEISGLAPAYDKQSTEKIQITGTPEGGSFVLTDYILQAAENKWYFFPILAPVGANNVIYYYRESPSSCYGYDTVVVRVLESNALIEFENNRTKYCQNDAPFTVTGVNKLDSIGDFSISGGVGLTDNGNNTATINPAILSPNKYIITYTYYDAGVPQPEQASFDVGVSPVADFKGATECFQEGQSVTLNNTSVSNFGFLNDTLFYWKILNKTGSGYLVNDTAKDISYTFTEPGNYNVSLELYNSNGCYAKTTKTFTLRPTILPAEKSETEEFETTTALSWTKGNSSDSPNSWVLGDPNKGFSDPFSGANCWFTLTQGARPPKEQSWVTSPCYDFRGTEKPMLKMQVWRLFNSNRDGANVQFSADSGKTWTPLGDLNDGISWYNYTYIPGLIGDNKIGWCVHPVTNIGNDTEWKEVKHSLDILKGKPQVQFRIAYGSDGSAQNNNGIAFDNFWIGERKRTALIEHFTNSSDMDCLEADSLLDAFTADNELSVINIQYHTSNPSGDPFYEDNPVIPSTREFYYGVSDVPYALLNGGVTGQHSFDYREGSKPLNKNAAIIESLREANFDISINSGIKNNNILDVEVDLVALGTLPMKELSVRVAVIEREIHGINGNNGDTVFRNVVKAMLPGAAGVSINKSWNLDDHQKIDLEWPLQNVYDPLQLRLVAFVQDEATYEVYQAKLDTIGGPVGIFDPRPEKPMKKNFVVYPNPANRSAFIRFENELATGIQINLYNNTGSLVYSNRIAAGNNLAEIPVEDLPDGIYMLRMTGKNQLIGISKLIISR